MTHQKVHDFLRQHPVGILSTSTRDGLPWGAAIYYVADEEFNIFFVTRADTTKYKNIESNPRVALTITDESHQITVQIAGEIAKVAPKDYMDVLFHKLEKVRPKHDISWAPPLSKIHKGNYIPLQLVPTKLSYANYGDYKLDPTASYVESIIG